MDNDKIENTGEEKVITRKQITKRQYCVLFAVAFVAVVIICIVSGTVISQSKARQLVKQLDLGQKYLENMEYEQAIVAFNKAIEIDPMSVEAYLGMVEVYIRTTDFESALEYAKRGYEATGDERLKEKIDMIESGNIFAENGWRMKESFYGENGLSSYCTYTYNLQGNTATATSYMFDGKISEQVDCKYDESGNQIEGYIETWSDDLIVHLRKVEKEYDSNGNVISEEQYNLDGTPLSYSTFEFDEQGKLVLRNDYKLASDGKSWEYDKYCTYEYNDEGGFSYRRWYDSEGNLTLYYEHLTDRMNTYNGDGILLNYWEYEYDSNGEIISSKNYDSDGKLIQEIVNN